MKLANIPILIIFFILLTISNSAQFPDAATEMNCYDQLKANNYPQAIKICSAVVAAKDDSAIAYRYRGLAYIQTGGIENYSKAETDFRKCVQLNPTNAECQYWLGYSIGSLSIMTREGYSRDCEETSSPIDDSFSFETTIPATAAEMRFAYREALSRNDGYNLLRLAKIENDKELLTEVKAGDILYNSYLIGMKFKYPDLLLNIAKYENQSRIMSIKAGDILQEAYNFSRVRHDTRTMIKVAIYENKENLITAKAGDIFYEAYTMAKNNRDVRTLLRIAEYEAELDLLTNINPEQIRQEAMAIYN